MSIGKRCRTPRTSTRSEVCPRPSALRDLQRLETGDGGVTSYMTRSRRSRGSRLSASKPLSANASPTSSMIRSRTSCLGVTLTRPQNGDPHCATSRLGDTLPVTPQTNRDHQPLASSEGMKPSGFTTPAWMAHRSCASNARERTGREIDGRFVEQEELVLARRPPRGLGSGIGVRRLSFASIGWQRRTTQHSALPDTH